MNKHNLTTAAASAATKFFSPKVEELPIESNSANITNHTNVTNNTKHTNVTNITNKSKHYDERGKRDVRHGLLLDKRLKEELTILCCATGNRSINDYIVSLLIEHVETPEIQNLLAKYGELEN